MLIGLSSLLGVMAIAPASFADTDASSIPLQILSAKAEDSGLRQGVPGRRISGGTRSGRIFASNYSSLTALVTPDNLSITVAERPTLLFYVPEMLAANQVELVLRDSRDELVYERTFTADREGGIISVDTAASNNFEPLSLNENYKWYFSIVPNVDDRSQDVVVHGSIRRVEKSDWLAQQQIDGVALTQLSAADPLAHARALYEQANMWHDAAVVLDELRRTAPESTAIAGEWNRLLESANLTAAVSASLPTVQVGLK